MKYILEHWRTSLGGLIMAILLAVQPMIMGEEAFDFQKDWMRFLMVGLIAAVGFLIKDPKKKDNGTV